MNRRYFVVDKATGEVVSGRIVALRTVRTFVFVALVVAVALLFVAVQREGARVKRAEESVQEERERADRAIEIAQEYREIYEEVKPYTTAERDKFSIFKGNSENYRSIQWSCDQKRDALDAELSELLP